MKTLCKFLSLALLGCLVFQTLSCGNFLKKQVAKIDLKKPLRTAEPTLDSLAYNVGQNLGTGLADTAHFIAQKLIQGLKGSMDTLDPDIQKIMRKIDSIGNLSNDQLLKLGKTIHEQIQGIKADVSDKEFANSLVGILEKLTGKLRADTKYLLANMVQEGLTSLGSDSAKLKLDKFIANLLSDTLTNRTQNLVTKALQPTIDSLEKKIDRIVNKVNKDVGIIQKYAWQWLALLGVLAFGIIAFIWYQRRRYLKLIKLLTFQINSISPKTSYDELTKQIQSQAQQDDLEVLLRKILKEQGINKENEGITPSVR